MNKFEWNETRKMVEILKNKVGYGFAIEFDISELGVHVTDTEGRHYHGKDFYDAIKYLYLDKHCGYTKCEDIEVDIDPELLAKFTQMADAECKTLDEFFIEACEEMIERNKDLGEP